MAESLHGMFLVHKKNTKSSVWHNFGVMATEDGRVIEKEREKLICRTCGKGVLAKGSNTTNLFQHLREHHPQIYADLASSSSKAKLNSGNNITESMKQTTLEELIAQSAKYLADSPQAKELNRAVTYRYHIAKDSMPISIVERPGFKYMLLKLKTRYQIPSRRHFTDYEIPQLHLHVKDNIVAESLKEVNFLQLPQTCGVVIVVILT